MATTKEQTPTDITAEEIRQQDDRKDIWMLDEQIKQTITNIENEQLTEKDIEFKNYLLTHSKIDILEEFDKWSSSLLPSKKLKTSDHTVHQVKKTSSNSKISKRKQRAVQYRKAQNEFRKNRSSYARSILDDISSEETITPDAEELEQFYRNIFCNASPEGNEIIVDRHPKTLVGDPVRLDELEECIKTTKTNTPGPDGIIL